MNSTSAIPAPARNASATPSPVETGGFVVWAKTCPNPPVPKITARPSARPTPSRLP